MSDQPEKPAVLQDTKFTIEEGFLYRAMRTGAIWMNKLFFGAVALLAIWLLLGLTGQVEPGCADSYQVEGANGTVDEPTETCSVFLSTTALYLGAMSVISFLLSIAFGLLGLVVGKNIIAMTPTAEEPGAPDPKDDP